MTMPALQAEPNMANTRVVLVVDDAPETLHMLCAALAEEAYTVLVARDGEEAKARFDLATPDAVLLDAVMPGLSGFDVCRWIKADATRAHVPVLFMTGLTETDHIVEGFASGGVDYVVKPVRVAEMLARLATHVRNAQVQRLARQAMDIGGQGVVMLDAQGRVAWQSPKASEWLADMPAHRVGAGLMAAAERMDGQLKLSNGSAITVQALGTVGLNETMLLLRPEGTDNDRSTQTIDSSVDALSQRLSNAALTPRETEVLSWLTKGKTNRDIGEILGMSPRTVNKHLEHVFEKLGVETRAAAAGLASRFMADS